MTNEEKVALQVGVFVGMLAEYIGLNLFAGTLTASGTLLCIAGIATGMVIGSLLIAAVAAIGARL